MKKLSKVYLFFVFAILYLPIFYLLVYAFNKNGTMNQFTGFTFAHFQTLFSDTRLLIIVLDTFLLAFLSATIATVIGTFASVFLFFSKCQIRNIYLSMNNILLVSPDVMVGASFLILFTVLGFKLGFLSVLLSHVAFSIPIVVLMVLPKLKEMNLSMISAAKDLGANDLQILHRVLLPFLTNSIIAGFFMAFTYSLDDFAVTFFVTGNGFSTLAVEIYSRARQGIDLEINALSLIVFLFSLVLVVGYYFISKEGGVRHQKNN